MLLMCLKERAPKARAPPVAIIIMVGTHEMAATTRKLTLSSASTHFPNTCAASRQLTWQCDETAGRKLSSSQNAIHQPDRFAKPRASR